MKISLEKLLCKKSGITEPIRLNDHTEEAHNLILFEAVPKQLLLD